VTEDIVLITGASSDIGVELVRRLAVGSVTVLAHGRSKIDRIEALAGATEAPARVVPLRADVGDVGQVQGLIDTVLNDYGTPRGFVHLPALPLQLVRFTDQTWEHLLTDLELQLRSAMLLLQSLLPRMRSLERRAKAVLMLSSATVGVPPASMTSYVVAKYAMLGLMRALAAEYADKSVNINAVSPSTVETRFLDDVPHKFAEISAARSPLKRNATPADIVPLIQFLLSAESDYVTGINIPIAGGTVA
jgi:3-oxoacyl-[acyl-carrier protein] reductase